MRTVHTLTEGHIVSSPHEPIEVKVKGYGATGYMWNVEANADQVRVVDHKLEPDLSAFGASGEESFILEPLVEGESEVTFTLAAPWENEPAKVHVLHLRCTSDP